MHRQVPVEVLYMLRSLKKVASEPLKVSPANKNNSFAEAGEGVSVAPERTVGGESRTASVTLRNCACCSPRPPR
jgi:hypothetical protein